MRRIEMVVCESDSSLAAAAVEVEEVEFSAAGMMRLGRLVGKVACEVMVTEGLPLTVAVVAPSPWVTEALVTDESSAEEVLVALLMRRVEVGSHS